MTDPAAIPRHELREELRQKYGKFRGLYNAESILLVVEEHEAMERVLLSIRKILEEKDAIQGS